MSALPQAWSADIWRRLADRLAARTGLWFPDARVRDLQNGIASIAAERGCSVPESVDWLLERPWGQPQLEACARHLTIGETYFFREPRAFDLLRRYAVAKLCDPNDGARSLRIWSAGCSTGEEPYSIAMTLFEVLDQAAWKRVSILATDINPVVLETAAAGTYREWSFRGGHESFRRKYFSRTGDGHYRIDERIRAAVGFRQVNLVDDDAAAEVTGALDLIFCRNVLMYLSEPQARAVVARFHRSLVDGGWLIPSSTEASQDLFSQFRVQLHSDAVHYQKRAGGQGAGHRALPPVLDSGVRSAPPAPEKPAPTRQRQRPAAVAGPKPPKPVASQPPAADASLDPEPYYLKAQTLLEDDQPEAAEVQLRQALFLAPDFAMAHYLLGMLMLRRGHIRQGRQHLRTVLSQMAKLPAGAIVPHSDGFTASQVIASVQSLLAGAGGKP